MADTRKSKLAFVGKLLALANMADRLDLKLGNGAEVGSLLGSIAQEIHGQVTSNVVEMPKPKEEK